MCLTIGPARFTVAILSGILPDINALIAYQAVPPLLAIPTAEAKVSEMSALQIEVRLFLFVVWDLLVAMKALHHVLHELTAGRA